MDEEIILYPTGTCFDDAIDYLNFISTQEPWNIKKFNKQWRVVHGICLMDDDKPYSHCWLQKGNSSYDFRMLNGEKVMLRYTNSEFQKKHRPQKQIRYTIKDCCDLEKRVHGYCGPWDEEIRNLCPDIKLKKAL